MTAQWWPWFDFRLVRRVPAAAFRPRPGVAAAAPDISRPALRQWTRHHRLLPTALPKSLTAPQWADLFHLTGRTGGPL